MNYNYMKMKSIKLLLTTAMLLSISLFSRAESCMMYPLSLNERVSQANLVVEGKVLGQKSFWNHDVSKIYTVNKIAHNTYIYLRDFIFFNGSCLIEW